MPVVFNRATGKTPAPKQQQPAKKPAAHKNKKGAQEPSQVMQIGVAIGLALVIAVAGYFTWQHFANAPQAVTVAQPPPHRLPPTYGGSTVPPPTRPVPTPPDAPR